MREEIKSKAEWHYGIWFIPGDGVDWMGKLVRRDSKWVFEYRFRYYADDKVFGSEDRKSWATASMADDSPEKLEMAVKGIEAVVPIIEEQLGNKVDFVKMEKSNDEPGFLFELASRSWAHVKIVDKDAAAKMGYTTKEEGE